MSRKRLKRAAILLAALTVAVGSGLPYMKLAGRRTPPGQPALVNLTGGDLGPFVLAFNSKPDSTRILLMLSPT